MQETHYLNSNILVKYKLPLIKSMDNVDYG
jgi:hypothetical protein